MNSTTLGFLFAGTFLIASTAFAQSAPSNSPANAHQFNGAPQVASNAASPTSATGGWVAPYGQPVAGKTRAQVYQELVHAEQDGQLAYLNSTIYAHP
ncbi:DUF4148 domain-containing protein [Paraburkholderia sp. SIMBA_055]